MGDYGPVLDSIDDRIELLESIEQLDYGPVLDSIEQLENGVSLGDSDAMEQLGYKYIQEGENEKKGVELLKKAVELKNTRAMVLLGTIYISGDRGGVEKDKKKGMELIKRAVDMGCSFAKDCIRQLNFETKKEELEKKVADDDANAMFVLAALYLEGKFGFQQDTKKGVELLEKAVGLDETIGLGDNDAVFVLGSIYMEGKYGLEKDIKSPNTRVSSLIKDGKIPCKTGPKVSGGLHIDQDRMRKGTANSIQCYLSLTKSDYPDFSTVFLRPIGKNTLESNTVALRKEFKEFYCDNPAEKYKMFAIHKEGFYIPPEQQDWLISQKMAEAYKPKLKPGDMLIWSSALPHCGATAKIQVKGQKRQPRLGVLSSFDLKKCVVDAHYKSRLYMLQNRYGTGQQIRYAPLKPNMKRYTGTFRVSELQANGIKKMDGIRTTFGTIPIAEWKGDYGEHSRSLLGYRPPTELDLVNRIRGGSDTEVEKKEHETKMANDDVFNKTYELGMYIQTMEKEKKKLEQKITLYENRFNQLRHRLQMKGTMIKDIPGGGEFDLVSYIIEFYECFDPFKFDEKKAMSVAHTKLPCIIFEYAVDLDFLKKFERGSQSVALFSRYEFTTGVVKLRYEKNKDWKDAKMFLEKLYDTMNEGMGMKEDTDFFGGLPTWERYANELKITIHQFNHETKETNQVFVVYGWYDMDGNDILCRDDNYILCRALADERIRAESHENIEVWMDVFRDNPQDVNDPNSDGITNQMSFCFYPEFKVKDAFKFLIEYKAVSFKVITDEEEKHVESVSYNLRSEFQIQDTKYPNPEEMMKYAFIGNSLYLHCEGVNCEDFKEIVCEKLYTNTKGYWSFEELLDIVAEFYKSNEELCLNSSCDIYLERINKDMLNNTPRYTLCFGT